MSFCSEASVVCSLHFCLGLTVLLNRITELSQENLTENSFLHFLQAFHLIFAGPLSVDIWLKPTQRNVVVFIYIEKF